MSGVGVGVKLGVVVGLRVGVMVGILVGVGVVVLVEVAVETELVLVGVGIVVGVEVGRMVGTVVGSSTWVSKSLPLVWVVGVVLGLSEELFLDLKVSKIPKIKTKITDPMIIRFFLLKVTMNIIEEIPIVSDNKLSLRSLEPSIQP